MCVWCFLTKYNAVVKRGQIVNIMVIVEQVGYLQPAVSSAGSSRPCRFTSISTFDVKEWRLEPVSIFNACSEIVSSAVRQGLNMNCIVTIGQPQACTARTRTPRLKLIDGLLRYGFQVNKIPAHTLDANGTVINHSMNSMYEHLPRQTVN